MAQTFGPSIALKRNPSMALTSRSFTSTKSLNDIKYEKRLYQRYSSSKSLRAIQQDYQKIAPNHDTVMKILFIRNKAVQKVHTLQNAKQVEALPLSLMMREKVYSLVHALFTDLQIYKKIQFTVKRQKSIVSKLYGWDQRFSQIFFQGQDIRSQVEQQKVEKVFFAGKSYRYDSQLRSIYNKMRLFHTELKQFNTKQMNLNVNVKERSLKQNLDKFVSKLRNLESPQSKRSEIAFKVRQFSPSKQKKSLGRVLGMKHGTEDEDFRIDNFDLKQGENFDRLQSIVENGYQSCRNEA